MATTFIEQTDNRSERERLEKLYGYNITNNFDKTGPFQHIVGMAAHVFRVPVAVVNFVDREKVLTRKYRI